jgi:hypothetical protein
MSNNEKKENKKIYYIKKLDAKKKKKQHVKKWKINVENKKYYNFFKNILKQE